MSPFEARLAAGLEGLATNEPFARLVGGLTGVEVTVRRALSRQTAAAVHWHERGDGPTVLLLNGWTASGLAWPARFLRVLERDLHVVRIDNRGTGWSRKAPVPFTIGDLAEDAARVLDAVGASTAHVLGLSMGGMIAQELAIRHPARVERLVLAGTRPPAPRQLPPAPGLVKLTMAPPPGPLETHLRSLWGSFCAPGFAEANEGLLDELIQQILQRVTPRFGVRAQARAIAGWTGWARLAHIQAPTTVVHGTLDRLMPVGNGMRLARMIPSARYVELPGVGHIVPMEAPDALAEIVGATTSLSSRRRRSAPDP